MTDDPETLVRDLASLPPDGPPNGRDVVPLVMRTSIELQVDKLLWLLFEGHAMRVMEWTVRVCLAMGCDVDTDLRSVRRGALVHDIGKIGVPDRIILKPGPLTPIEWQMMRQHPRWGYQLCIGNELLHRDWHIPYCHHERWDGTGYPQGLKGDAIPLAARAFAPIDVLDALSEHRPYRAEIAPEDAWVVLEKGRGTHFDPRALDAFRAIWDEDQRRDAWKP